MVAPKHRPHTSTTYDRDHDAKAAVEGDQTDYEAPKVNPLEGSDEPEIPGWWVRAFGVGVPYAPSMEGFSTDPVTGLAIVPEAAPKAATSDYKG